MNRENVVYLYTMEYYSDIQKDKFVLQVENWMPLETIMLSETYQTQKITYFMASFIRETQNLNNLKSEITHTRKQKGRPFGDGKGI